MAMMVILGVIVVVSLLGFVGLNMAAKDRFAAGDNMDIKSQDVALESAFNLAVARLQEDPLVLKTILENFVADSSKPVGTPPRSWLDFSGSTVVGSSKAPAFFKLDSLDPRSARFRVEIKAVGFPPVDLAGALDPRAISEGSGYEPYLALALEATAMGRAGDEIHGIANYKIYGIGRRFTENGASNSVTVVNTLSLGGELKDAGNGVNFSPDITGDAYIGGGVILNNNNQFRSRGTLKVNGDFWVMSNSVRFDQTTYIKGTLRFENTGIEVVSNGNLGVGGSILHKAGKLTANGNVWIGTHYKVDDLDRSNIAITGGLRTNSSDTAIKVNNLSGTTKGKVGGGFFPAKLPTLPQVGASIDFGSNALIADPSLVDFGIPTTISSTELKDNLPELIDTTVLTNIFDWDSIYSIAGAGTYVGSTTPDPGAAFNKVFAYLRTLNGGSLHKGYMVVRMTGNNHLNFPNGAGSCPGSCTAFEGKAIFLIDGKVDVNAGWPPSKDSNAIQVIVVRNGKFPSANLNAFGFTTCGSKDFYGYLYWDNPQTSPVFNMSCAASTWHGSFTVTPKNHLSTTPSAASIMFNNSSKLKLAMSNSVFGDINKNIPGLIKPRVPQSQQGGAQGMNWGAGFHLYTSQLQIERTSVFR
jgi:hypothetical protein